MSTSFIQSLPSLAALSVLAVCTCVAWPACAEDLGAKAPTYRIDPDAREEFRDVIRSKKSTGELDRFWQTYRDKTLDAIKNPAPLGLRSDYAVRTEFKPVRFVVPSDYLNERGELVVRRGTVVEPLKLQPLTSGLVFIDGRDPAQVDYAIARGRQTPLKIVLTAGSPLALRVKYQRAAWGGGARGVGGGSGAGAGGGTNFPTPGIPFYFDQRRIILDTLRKLYGIDIQTVPTVLTQEGAGLRVESGLLAAANPGVRP